MGRPDLAVPDGHRRGRRGPGIRRGERWLWPQPPCPVPFPRLPLTASLVSTGTLDRHAGDLILSAPNPPPTACLCHSCGSGQFLLERNKESELRELPGVCWGLELEGRGPASHWGLRRRVVAGRGRWPVWASLSSWRLCASAVLSKLLTPFFAWETHTLDSEPIQIQCPA